LGICAAAEPAANAPVSSKNLRFKIEDLRVGDRQMPRASSTS